MWVIISQNSGLIWKSKIWVRREIYILCSSKKKKYCISRSTKYIEGCDMVEFNESMMWCVFFIQLCTSMNLMEKSKSFPKFAGWLMGALHCDTKIKMN